MSARDIVSYVPNPRRQFESFSGGPLAARAVAVAPTPDELAELSRALQLLEDARPRPGVMTTVPDQFTSLLQTYLAEQATAQGRAVESRNGTLEVRFDEHDILGWASSLFTWWRKFHKFDWQTPGAPERVADVFRVAVLSDWGTGLYGAPECGKRIEEAGQKEQTRHHMVLHLGDVYYSGTEKEMAERFLDIWPKVPNAINRALNGNHEMYTGGQAYYERVLSRFNQKASYFAVENNHWVLGCLDTAYDDHDLHGEQARWVEQLAGGLNGRRLVLFSHHQPFSLMDNQGPKLVKQLANPLQRGQIFAWYWGHEHHCVLYDRHPLWGLHGRCIGHSGFPYFRDKHFGAPPAAPEFKKLPGKNLVPGAQVLDGINQFISDDPQDYGPNGYVSLEFDGPELIETVHDADGTVLWNRPVGE
jgi:predicted phosphodiesterase